MLCAFLRRANEPLVIQNHEIPIPKSNEVRIKIFYAGINHRDLWVLKGQYRGSSENLILGSDGSGIVDSVGADILGFTIGEEVMINPSLNWGIDEKVQGEAFKILGNPDPGTFSEFIVVPHENVHKKPEQFSLEEAAAIPLAGLTAFRALFTKGKVQKNDQVLITGIGGGVAQMAFQMAIAHGCKVYITSSDPVKIKQATQLGAVGGFLYTRENWVDEAKLASGKGFNVIIDSASGKGFSDLIDLTMPGGNLVFFGGTRGSIGPIVPAKVFWRQINILGTTMGSPLEFRQLLHFYAEHRLKPVIDSIYPFQEINNAFERMELGLQKGKILLKINKN